MLATPCNRLNVRIIYAREQRQKAVTYEGKMPGKREAERKPVRYRERLTDIVGGRRTRKREKEPRKEKVNRERKR